MEADADGVVRMESERPLGDYPPRWTDSLDHWATVAPERTFLAERGTDGEWRRVSYKAFRERARGLAAWLLTQPVSTERPVAILSGNDLEHAVLSMAALYAGVPFAPVSPSYSLVSRDFGKLRHVLALLTPGLIFAPGERFGPALRAASPVDALVMEALPEVRAEGDLPQVEPDAVAKVLFTSGSTGMPKGVITTHRMLASNQQMLLEVFPFFRQEPLVICDWLPWNHVFGGNHNFGLVLYNGGTLYLDAGRPTPGLFEHTRRNLREIAPTAYFNVPKGYEMLAAAMRADRELRESFFSRLHMMFYAAAGLPQHIWDELDRLSLETRGERVPMLTGLGATETAPFAICADSSNRRAGVIGLPVPGMRLKLAPVGGKLEARARGPHVTPGYWRQPELTAAAFDDEGYYRFGDAVRFLDENDPTQGLVFDGRLNEDFKLATGTWVSSGPLRTRLILHCAPYLRDAVIAGRDRNEVTALLFADPDHGATPEILRPLLESFAAASTGSSTRIARAVLLDEPPSLDDGEVTDKGSIHQAAVLQRRAAIVESLYAEPYPAEAIVV